MCYFFFFFAKVNKHHNWHFYVIYLFIYFFQKKWTLGADKYYHFSREEKAEEPLPAVELATQAIAYARELEMIV